MATMRVTLGGRIAEEVFFDEISSGAAADIKQATEIARTMVREWGMGDSVGFVYYGDSEAAPGFFDVGPRTYSEKTAETIDGEVKNLLDSSYTDVRRIMAENRDKVETVAQALLKFETITGEETNALLRGESLDRASVSDLLDDAAADDNVGVARPVKADPKPDTELGEGTLPQPG